MAFENLQDRQFVPEELIEQLKDYDTMKSHLMMDLVGKEANFEKLQSVAHTDMEDMAITYRFLITRTEEGQGTIQVTKDMHSTPAFFITEMKGMMIMTRLTKYEKETILRTSKGDKKYNIYTFDPVLQKKLGKFAKKYPELCEMKEATKEGSMTYEIEKTRVSIRLMESWSEEKRISVRKRVSSLNK